MAGKMICRKCPYFRPGIVMHGYCLFFPDRPRPMVEDPVRHPRWCPLAEPNRARTEAAEAAEWEAIEKELQMMADGHPGFQFRWRKDSFEDGLDLHWFLIASIERKRPEEE